MKPNRLPSILLVVPLAIATLACPTRTIPIDAGDGMAGSGGSVDSGTDRGGENGAGGTGGAGGMSGKGGAGIVSGAAGSGGTSGTSGASGTGGIGGTGTAGATGIGGIGGAATSVVCGTVTTCPVANGGQCCYSAMDQSSTCQGAAANCDPVPSGAGTYYIKTTITCDSSADCSGGEVCCYTQMYIDSRAVCMAASSCVDIPPPTGGYVTTRRQVCDPAKVAPSECLSGSCKPAPTLSQSLPPYLSLCL